jgi:hypothetical protein
MNGHPLTPDGIRKSFKVLAESTLLLPAWALVLILTAVWVWLLLKGLGWVDATLVAWLS